MRGAVAVPRMPGGAAAFSAATYRPVDAYLSLLQNTSTSLAGPVTRAQALSVAAVQRARNQVCSIATLPIHTYKGLQVDTTVHTLLRQIDPNVANVVTLAQTLEDLLFDGVSWWLITAQDFAGFPLSARHVPLSSVSEMPPPGSAPAPLPSGLDPGTPAGRFVWIDGEPIATSRVIRFDSPNPGMLEANARAIKRALLLDTLAATYARNPRPLDYFTDNLNANVELMTPDQIKSFLADWADVRSRNATAKIPTALEYHAGDTISAADLQLVQLQQEVTLEIANGAGIDPEDLGLSTTSRTYFNAQDRRTSKVNETYAPFMKAITDRLSMGDVTRRGYDTRFDLTDYLKPDTATLSTVAATLIGAGVMDPNEARPWFNLSGRAPKPAPAPAPAADPAETASTRPSATFAASERFTAPSSAHFAVDVEKRTIRGVAVPYGVAGSKYGMTYTFDGPGSVVQPGSGNVKHFIDHVTPIGRVFDWEDKPDGLYVAMSVMPGAEGDQLLAAAQHGVYDGLSVGIDWEASDSELSGEGGSITFSKDHPATAREVSTTAIPVFDGARVTSVAASQTRRPTRRKASDVDDETTTAPAPETTPAPETATAPGKWNNPDSPGPGTSMAFSADQVAAFMNAMTTAGGGRAQVDPIRTPALASVREPMPYTFSRTPVDTPRGRRYDWAVSNGEHSFGADLKAMMYAGDQEGRSESGRRVMAALGHVAAATFAGVASTDVSGLNPNIQRPDMYVDVPDYRYPIMALINRGAPPNGIQPFTFPKFATSSALVAAHVEGTEPAQGVFTATTQTVTPTASSGEVNITRETIDMGGNPAAQTLIFNKMLQSWFEALETNAATFLNTLTAATDISLNTGATGGAAPTSAQLFTNWTTALSGLPFTRGYDYTAMVIEKNLYQAFALATDTAGAPLFPMVGPTNRNGGAAPRFTSLDLGGVTGIPSWALTATAGSLNNSWLFDPATVYAWATQPERLDFPGRKPADGSYAPVAWVGMGIFGYSAFANTDINGVRQVTYDTTT